MCVAAMINHKFTCTITVLLMEQSTGLCNLSFGLVFSFRRRTLRHFGIVSFGFWCIKTLPRKLLSKSEGIVFVYFIC